MMKKINYFGIISLFFLLISCNSAPIAREDPTNTDTIRQVFFLFETLN